MAATSRSSVSGRFPEHHAAALVKKESSSTGDGAGPVYASSEDVMRLGVEFPQPVNLPPVELSRLSLQETCEDLMGRLSMALHRIKENGDSRFVLMPEDLYVLWFARDVQRQIAGASRVGSAENNRATLAIKLLTDLMKKLPQDADGVVHRQRTRGGSSEDLHALMNALHVALKHLSGLGSPLRITAPGTSNGGSNSSGSNAPVNPAAAASAVVPAAPPLTDAMPVSADVAELRELVRQLQRRVAALESRAYTSRGSGRDASPSRGSSRNATPSFTIRTSVTIQSPPAPASTNGHGTRAGNTGSGSAASASMAALEELTRFQDKHASSSNNNGAAVSGKSFSIGNGNGVRAVRRPPSSLPAPRPSDASASPSTHMLSQAAALLRRISSSPTHKATSGRERVPVIEEPLDTEPEDSGSGAAGTTRAGPGVRMLGLERDRNVVDQDVAEVDDDDDGDGDDDMDAGAGAEDDEEDEDEDVVGKAAPTRALLAAPGGDAAHLHVRPDSPVATSSKASLDSDVHAPSKHSHSGNGNALYALLRALGPRRGALHALIREYPEEARNSAVGTICAVLRRNLASVLAGLDSAASAGAAAAPVTTTTTTTTTTISARTADAEFTADVDALMTVLLLQLKGTRFARPAVLVAALHRIGERLGLHASLIAHADFLVSQARRLPRGAVHKAWNKDEGTIDLVRLINGARAMVREIDSAGMRKERDRKHAARDTASDAASVASSASGVSIPGPAVAVHTLPGTLASPVSASAPPVPIPGLSASVPAPAVVHLSPHLRTFVLLAAVELADSFVDDVLPLVRHAYAQTADAEPAVATHMRAHLLRDDPHWPLAWVQPARASSAQAVIASHLEHLRRRVVQVAAALIHQHTSVGMHTASGTTSADANAAAAAAARQPESKRRRVTLDLERDIAHNLDALTTLKALRGRLPSATCAAERVVLADHGNSLRLLMQTGAKRPQQYRVASIEVNDTLHGIVVTSRPEAWHPGQSEHVRVHKPDAGCVYVLALPDDVHAPAAATWDHVVLLRYDSVLEAYRSVAGAGA